MEYEEHLKTFNQIKESTESSFRRTHNIPPHLVRVTAERVDLIFIAEMSSQSEKDMVARLMKQLIREGAEAVCFCTEAWSLEAATAESYEKAMSQYVMPSCHPDRLEIVMMQYSYAGGELWATSPICRPEYDPWDESTDPENFEDFEPVLAEWRVIDSTTEEGDIKKEGRFCNLWEAAFLDEDSDDIEIRCMNINEFEEIAKDREDDDPPSIEEISEIWHEGFPPFKDKD